MASAKKVGGSSSGSSKLSMKLLVDKKTQSVVYAEAGKDVVDFLFSLLTLPIGTVVKLLAEKDLRVGSVSSLYRSVEKLDNTYICHDDARAAKKALLKPAGGCQTKKLPLITRTSSSTGSSRNGGSEFVKFVKGAVTYMVMDNLKVSPLSTISATTVLNDKGITDLGSLKEKTVELGYTEALHILKESLESKTVLTKVFLRSSSRRA